MSACIGAALCLIGALAVDGDTLRVPLPGNDLRVRIHGIDAPERKDPAGPAATAFMAALIEGQVLACEPLDVEKYGRVVARCRLPGRVDLACIMVAAGHARDWPEYSGGAYRACAEDRP